MLNRGTGVAQQYRCLSSAYDALMILVSLSLTTQARLFGYSLIKESLNRHTMGNGGTPKCPRSWWKLHSKRCCKQCESSLICDNPYKILTWKYHSLEENYQANAHLPSHLRANGYQFPVKGNTSFNAVFKTPLDFYTYCNENDPERGARFAIAMTEVTRRQLPSLGNGYPFEKLESRSRYVDVAGGLGHTCYFLARRLPEATFVVQDHQTVLAEAKKACPAELRDRVAFEPQDMFSAQPKSGTAAEQTPSGTVFLLKIILHDHGDEACRTILRNLLAVMGATDRILIVDLVIPETAGSISSSMSDLLTLSLFGSRHRSLREWKALIDSSETSLTVKTFAAGAEEFDGLMVIEVQKGQDIAL
jgi:hypothetical protein